MPNRLRQSWTPPDRHIEDLPEAFQDDQPAGAEVLVPADPQGEILDVRTVLICLSQMESLRVGTITADAGYHKDRLNYSSYSLDLLGAQTVAD